jgi:hypothetical protein
MSIRQARPFSLSVPAVDLVTQKRKSQQRSGEGYDIEGKSERHREEDQAGSHQWDPSQQ